MRTLFVWCAAFGLPVAIVWNATMGAVLYVCTTCRANEEPSDEAPCPGARLYAAIAASEAPPDVQVMAVECLSACSQGCAVALAAPGRWSYVYGRLTEADVPAILAGAGLYARAADGIVPWRERPDVFRKQSLARIPPLTAAATESASEGA